MDVSFVKGRLSGTLTRELRLRDLFRVTELYSVRHGDLPA